MQVIGKIGVLRQVPFYLGHQESASHHITVLCNELGEVYTETQLATADLSIEEVTEFLAEQLDTVAAQLQQPINLIGICAPQGCMPHIVDYAKS
jgi:hypothetical protein